MQMDSVINAIQLDARLHAAAQMVPAGARFADIGCDHGFLSAYLIREGKVCHCQLCDISAPSLAKAKRLFRKLDISENVLFCVGDGAKALTAPVDCAVVAGMGSSTIMHIIADGRDLLGNARLVLQPNLNENVLRCFLCENGYAIVDETVVRAGRRHYVLLAAEPGQASYSPVELLCGPVLLRKNEEAFFSYAQFRIRVAKEALCGAEASEPERAKVLRWEIATWQDVSQR